ncbi:helix-turn-helix domain-containing protein [Desmospora activa]
MRDIMAKKLVCLRGVRPRTEVASKLHISVSALQMYENGRRVPRDDIKLKLAQFYGVSVEYLFFQQEDEEHQTGKIENEGDKNFEG